MPTVESHVFKIFFLYNRVLVKGTMMRMSESDVLKSFIRWDESITDDLNLMLIRDGLEIWMKNLTFAIQSFAVTVICCCGIEQVIQSKLLCRSNGRLVFNQY